MGGECAGQRSRSLSRASEESRAYALKDGRS